MYVVLNGERYLATVRVPVDPSDPAGPHHEIEATDPADVAAFVAAQCAALGCPNPDLDAATHEKE